MTRTTLGALAILLVLATMAVAGEEAPPKRGFVDGKFVDEYFGISYSAEDLKEGFAIGVGGPTVLWAGKCAGEVDVEVSVAEAPHEMDAAAWRQAFLENWAKDGKERKEMEQGDGPPPWVLFVQESIAGFQRHHGYAFHARGYQAFLVHAQVREKSETSAEAIRKALQGLVVGEAPDSFALAHVVARQGGRSPTDPVVLAMTGQMYLSDQAKNPALALRAFALAWAGAKEGTFDADQTWQIRSGMGLAQLTLGQREEAIATWKECIELAGKTTQPVEFGANSNYNLACAYSLLGRLDEAFAALEAAFGMGESEEVAGLREHALQDPDLANLRQDARWPRLYPEGVPAPDEEE